MSLVFLLAHCPSRLLQLFITFTASTIHQDNTSRTCIAVQKRHGGDHVENKTKEYNQIENLTVFFILESSSIA